MLWLAVLTGWPAAPVPGPTFGSKANPRWDMAARELRIRFKTVAEPPAGDATVADDELSDIGGPYVWTPRRKSM
jgi:hypothetical protein